MDGEGLGYLMARHLAAPVCLASVVAAFNGAWRSGASTAAAYHARLFRTEQMILLL